MLAKDIAALHKALFLDRDGVINIDHGYVCTAERTEFVEGIFDLCRQAKAQNYLIIVITNQAGIARGYYSEPEFNAYMSWMHIQFKQRNAVLDAVYYCPHHPIEGGDMYLQDCSCRKPKPGMLRQAMNEHELDMTASIMVGDNLTDMQAALEAGVGTRVLLTEVSLPFPSNFSAVQHISQVHSFLK